MGYRRCVLEKGVGRHEVAKRGLGAVEQVVACGCGKARSLDATKEKRKTTIKTNPCSTTRFAYRTQVSFNFARSVAKMTQVPR